MSQLLTWSEVDSNIQSEMGNQVPSEGRRLEAMNNVVRKLNTKYDVTSARRTVEISVIPNGTLYIVAELVNSSDVEVLTDDDLKKIDLLAPDDDDDMCDYEWIAKNEFFKRLNSGRSEDTYTTFFKDGKLYFAMNSQDGETVATTYNMDYFSTFLALDGTGTFIDEITAVATTKILIPANFKDLVVSGSIRKLLYPSLGDEGNAEYNKKTTLYRDEIKSLGLDSVTKPLQREKRKVKIHKP